VSQPEHDLVARLERDVADLERLMVDMPPHHAGGTRRSAEDRLEDLRSELRRARRAATDEESD
jgi:hypothetical protein